MAQELRIAPVMTGGTSLAVWMGGVTAELYCLLAAGSAGQVAPASTGSPEPASTAIYRALLELVNLDPRVDVITGTSAGGLNGTLLGAAWRCRAPAGEFVALRDMWLELADLQELLRSPRESDPPSLLRGDEYFRAQIEVVLSRWKENASGWADEAAASATSEPIDHPLDLLITVTTVQPEPRRRRDDYGETISDTNHAHRLWFNRDDVSAADTRWPTKLAIASRTSASIPGVFEPSYIPIGTEAAAASLLPDFEPHASFRRSHFAVDGGVVVNLPLKEALERVFYQSAEAPVRRVVMFIQPTPKVSNRPAVQHDQPPSIRDSLGTVVAAPRAEGITEEVDRIKRHNETVRRQAATRRSIHLVAGDDIVASADRCMEAYRVTRTWSSVRHTSGYVASALDGRHIDREDVERWLFDAREALVPRSVNSIGNQRRPLDWAWGIAPIEHAASMVQGLIRSAPAPSRDALRAEWRQVSEQLDFIRTVRERDRAYWTQQLTELTDTTSDEPFDEERLVQWSVDAYAAWPGGMRHVMLLNLMGTFNRIVAQLASAAATLRRASDLPDELAAELDALAPSGLTAAELRTHVRAIHVLQTVLIGDLVAREQQVELQIVSWNAANYLQPNRAPEDKLAGPELARLGAFLKRSWRANDWFWGRMDGASRLTQMLLGSRPPAPTARSRGAWTQQVDKFVATPALALNEREQAIVGGELRRLAVDGCSPQSTIEIVAERLQRGIAVEELPHVERAVRQSIEEERSNDLNGAVFLRSYKELGARRAEPSVARQLVHDLKVGRESVGTEFGYGLLNRTISRGSAVAVNAMSGAKMGVPFLARFLKPLRTPLHTVNSVVAAATSAAPLQRFLSALLFAVAGSLVGLRLAGQEVSTPLLVAAEILLAGALVAALVRSAFLWHAVVLLPIVAILGLALVGRDVDAVLYDSAESLEQVEISSGSVIDLGDDALVRITSATGSQELTEDLVLESGAIEIRSDGAKFRSAPEVGTATWKRRVFTGRLPVAAFVLAALGLSAGVGLGRLLWSRRSQRREAFAVGIAGLATVAASVLVVIPGTLARVTTRWMTGPSGDEAPLAKRAISSGARELSEVRVELLVVGMIVVAMILGSAFDLVVRRQARRIELWWRNRRKRRATATGGGQGGLR